MAVASNLLGEFDACAIAMFDSMVSSEDKDKLIIREQDSFNATTNTSTPGKTFKLRGIMASIPVNKVNDKEIQATDVVLTILADELLTIPKVGMTVQEQVTSPRRAISQGFIYTVYGFETDPAGVVHQLFLRR